VRAELQHAFRPKKRLKRLFDDLLLGARLDACKLALK